ncbi:MAG: hypothetical protein WCO55_05110 [Candidatus Falkowbacteria bacterium]
MGKFNRKQKKSGASFYQNKTGTPLHQQNSTKDNSTRSHFKKIDEANELSLNQQWSKYLQSNLESEIAALHHDYAIRQMKIYNFPLNDISDEELSKQIAKYKKDMATALLLWKFIKMNFSKHGDYKFDIWQKRNEAYIAFINSIAIDQANSHMLTVINIESLPTPVWRKFLWKNNINFESNEACLRRMSQDEREALADNAGDLFASKTPRVFSWIDHTFRKVSYQDLMMSRINFNLRYSTKCTMSYNFLDMDFGFNAYPEGENNDYKVVEISPMRFLSKKNHVKDFVVNQEDGLYWWLYRFARSNYVYKPYKTVELKNHFCPGFWYTLIANIIFWIASPLLFVSAVQQMFVNYWFIHNPYFWLAAVPGLMLPLWSIAAGIKKAFRSIDITDEQGRKMALLLKRFGKYVIIPIGFAAMAGVAWLIIIGLIKVYAWLYLYTSIGGPILLTWLIAFLSTTIYLKAEHGYVNFKEQTFKGCKNLFELVPLIGVGNLIGKFYIQIWQVITIIATFIYDAVIYAGWPLLIISILFLPLLIAYFYYKYKDPSKMDKKTLELFYDRLDRIVMWTMAVVVAAIFITAIYLIIDYHMTAIMIVPLCLMAAIGGIALELAYSTKDSIYHDNPKTSLVYDELNNAGWSSMRLFKLLSENSWLLSLDDVDKKLALGEFSRFIRDYLNSDGDIAIYASKIAPVLNRDLLDKLNYLLANVSWFHNYVRALSLVLAGSTPVEAMATVKKEYEQENKNKLAIKAWFNKQLNRIWRVIRWLATPLVKVWTWIVTLWRLGDYFVNGMCPWVARSEVIQD